MTSDPVVKPLPSYISQLQCGLGWDAQLGTELDLDMAVMALNAQGYLADGKEGFIYAGHPRHRSGAIRLLNDCLTGEGEGDDEQLLINLLTLPSDIKKLMFVVNIEGGEAQQQDFSQIQNAFWRLLDSASQEVLLHCTLSNLKWDSVTTLMVAELERDSNAWQLASNLLPSPLKTLNALFHQYHG